MTVVLPEALITASFISFHAAYKVTLCKNVVCDLLQPRKDKFILKAGDGQSLSSSLCVDPEWFWSSCCGENVPSDWQQGHTIDYNEVERWPSAVRFHYCRVEDWFSPKLGGIGGISALTLPPALSVHVLSHLEALMGQEPYLEAQKSSPGELWRLLKEFSLYLVHKRLFPPLLSCRDCSVATLRLLRYIAVFQEEKRRMTFPFEAIWGDSARQCVITLAGAGPRQRICGSPSAGLFPALQMRDFDGTCRN